MQNWQTRPLFIWERNDDIWCLSVSGRDKAATKQLMYNMHRPVTDRVLCSNYIAKILKRAVIFVCQFCVFSLKNWFFKGDEHLAWKHGRWLSAWKPGQPKPPVTFWNLWLTYPLVSTNSKKYITMPLSPCWVKMYEPKWWLVTFSGDEQKW